MTIYRCYEARRNTGGGLDGVMSGGMGIDAATAQDAADEYAELLRDGYQSAGDTDLESVVAVATDDDGDSAEAEVSS